MRSSSLEGITAQIQISVCISRNLSSDTWFKIRSAPVFQNLGGSGSRSSLRFFSRMSHPDPGKIHPENLLRIFFFPNEQ